MAAPESREQRPADLGLDLVGLEIRIGPHPDRAADIVDQHVDPPEAGDRLRHSGRRACVGFEVGAEACRPLPHFSRDIGDELGAVDQQHLRTFGSSA
jgi:hypothetical protein